jgi:predicted signal transduction protein with EAL and GGDEF domain
MRLKGNSIKSARPIHSAITARRIIQPVAGPQSIESFVRQLTMTADDTTIVSAIISMGQSLRLRVIAGGVETLGGLEFL